jgi:hypothetical protein
MESNAVEEIKRHFGIIAESLRSDMRVLAEGQDLLREKLDGVAQIVQLTYSEVTGRLNDHEARLDVIERPQQ